MTHDMNEAMARLEQRTNAGLALLSDEAQTILAATPEDFCRAFAVAVLEVQAEDEKSDFGRGLYFGRALGIITAGAALKVITFQQMEVLMTALNQVKPR